MDAIDKVNAVISSIFDGLTLQKALKTHDCSASMFYKTLEKYPELQVNYAYAEKYNADVLAEEIISIADSEENYGKARNQIDARKWLAGKRAPKKYGDRIDVNVEGSIDLSAAIDAASKRIALPNSYLNTPLVTEHIETIEITHDNNTGCKPADDDDAIKKAMLE